MKKKSLNGHVKSSAMVVSLAIHLLFIVVAFSFVAVTVVQRNEVDFEALQVKRPKVNLRKLQVPVNVKTPAQQPKLRKQIVVAPKINRVMPDIKMPEILGVKGGMGAGASGSIGGAGGIGFSMPELELFGVKGKGEKVLIALDSDALIMRDEVGGMRAYTIIKDEVCRIISGLPPTVLFNVAVFEQPQAFALFPSMVPANSANVARVKEWLEPLNEVKEGMGEKEYGVKTLPSGGTQIEFARYNGKYGKVADGRHWYLPAALAMEQQADTVFILTGWWGVQDHDTDEKAPGWSESEVRRWNEKLAKSTELLKQENKERLARGEPPRVLRDNNELVNAYFPGSGYFPRQFKQYIYTSKDFVDALYLCREDYASRRLAGNGLPRKKSQDRFSINVIFFAPKDTGISTHEEEMFQELTSKFRGELKVLSGLEAIHSTVSGTE